MSAKKESNDVRKLLVLSAGCACVVGILGLLFAGAGIAFFVLRNKSDAPPSTLNPQITEQPDIALRESASEPSVPDEKHVKSLDAETRVLELRAEEQRFRHKFKDQRDNDEVMKNYSQLLITYADALTKVKDVKREQRPRARNQHWFKLGLDTSKHPELLMYRIRWSSGNWSSWFVPGFNDREKGKGRDVRYWACFNDHKYEVILTTRKELHREIQDLP